MRNAGNGSVLFLRLTLTLLVVFFVPVLLGIWLDSQAQTSPFITLFAIFFGTTLGTLAVMRQIAGMYQQLVGDKS